MPIFGVGAVRVISGVGNLASKNDGTSPCSFRDEVFCDFFKKIQKTNLFIFFQVLKLRTQ